MGFVEEKIKEGKGFGNLVFPRTLHPSHTCEKGATHLVEAIKANGEWLREQVRSHGAILFRGFEMWSPEEFRSVVEAFGWENMDYMGATTRVKVADRVYTANEAPLNQLINFHHEMALMKDFPSKIFFFCSEPPPEGGETSIVLSHVVVEKMEEAMPEFVSKLENVGAVLRLKTAKENSSEKVVSKTWQWLLQTEDKVEARRRAQLKVGCSSLEFLDDGTAEFVYGPLNPIRTYEGKRAWFYPILGYTNNPEDIDVHFGDGTPLPVGALEIYRKILDVNSVDLQWQKGDVLVVDNLSVQHARRPGKPPRVILVSICK
ncbi:clavaminate synthase-like protein At3g21360 [Amborella trichopoda]|uniref:TauD/TfdA-like domain-containing protein n=1 Tax=Amborella trichopoda TaxID=13333 RepID=U5D2X9_AMBTC|nr:clavaminate synthase-like protein At3g21360 [Amborella trichopoda]ERN19971.1 hypothetical protein AMTR_s00071p00133840 [Amborella trichopoda]|eukprot:XP_006858504.1 clavaminate synthase-like protein At3g21360 [Amborella trichopoda]